LVTWAAAATFFFLFCWGSSYNVQKSNAAMRLDIDPNIGVGFTQTFFVAALLLLLLLLLLEDEGLAGG
jgi:hypothetical protein